MKIKLKFRDATAFDTKFLLDLKNDKDVRKWSIASKDKIKMENHIEWLKKYINDIVIITDGKKDYGDVRVTKDNEIAIKLNKLARGKGIGTWAIEAVMKCKKNLTAKIVDGNIPSMRLFIKCGFRLIDHKTTNGVHYYILKS